jgi:hypothetical protein
MQTIFPEQDARDPKFWGKIYEATKGDNFHTLLRMRVNVLFADLCLCSTDVARAMCQGRAMELREMLEAPEQAMAETKKLMEAKKASKKTQDVPENEL